LGPDHIGTARLQEPLGGVLRDLGQYDEAFEMYKAALEEKIRRHAGADHPGTVSSMNSVAATLAAAGRLDEARGYIDRAREMNARITSGNSVYTILSHQTLANIARQEQAFAEAERQFGLAMAMAEDMLRPDHRYMLGVLTDYAEFMMETDRLGEAISILERVVEGRGSSLGTQHPKTLSAGDALDDARRTWEAQKNGIPGLSTSES
jgi:tetratricopeptide (TPR) repeat protein